MTPRYALKNGGVTIPQAIAAPKQALKQKTSPMAKTLAEVKVAMTLGGVAVFGPRVAQLLAGRAHGLFKAQVEKMYEKQWSERLPVLWEEVLESGGWGLRVVRVGSKENPVCTMAGEKKAEPKQNVVQQQLEQVIKAKGSLVHCNGVEKIDTTDWIKIEKRIEEIVARRVDGWIGSQVTGKVWGTISPPQIEKMYMKLHSEALPSGWDQVLEERGSLQVAAFHLMLPSFPGDQRAQSGDVLPA